MTEPVSTKLDATPAPQSAAIAPLGAVVEGALIATGGALGALARAALTAIVPSSLETVALATQLVNGLGAFALGLLLAQLERRRPLPHLRPFLAVGVLGSFTTFSALVEDGRDLAEGRSPWITAAFLAVSIAVGMAAFVLGQGFDRSLRRAGRLRTGSAR